LKELIFTSNWRNFWHGFASRGFVSDSWAFLFIVGFISDIKFVQNVVISSFGKVVFVILFCLSAYNIEI